MKQGWKIKKLGEVCDFQNGFAFKSNTYKETGLPILRITNIQNQVLEINDLVYFDNKDYKENFDRFKVFKDDLVVAMSGATTGKLGINKSDTVFYLNQRVGKFTPKKEILKPFLYFFLTTKVEESLRIAAGAAQPNLSTEQINNFEIPIPPLPEQQRIVSILDQAFAAIDKAKANTEQNLKNAKELFESYLEEVFESKNLLHNETQWEERTLEEVCAKITDGTHQTPKYYDSGIIFLSSRNVTSGQIDWKNIKFIDQKQHIDMHKRVSPKLGDILLAKNGTTGVAALVDKNVVFDIYVSLALIRVLDNIIPEFMLYFINSPVAKRKFNKRLKGSGVPNLHLEEINQVRITFPKSKNDQIDIVNALNVLRSESKKLEVVYQKEITYLGELKKSILQKAFNGEL